MSYHSLIYILFLSITLYAAKTAVLYFISSFVLAYLLHPAVELLNNLKIPKSISALFMLFLFMCCFFMLIWVISPIMYNQSLLVLEKLSYYRYSIQANFMPKFLYWMNAVPEDILLKIEETIRSLAENSLGLLVGMISSFLKSGSIAINIASAVVLIPIIAFYILRDWINIASAALGIIPIRYKEIAKRLAHNMDTTMSGYLRGQIYACIIMAAYYSISLSLLKLESPIALGLLSGILIVIPYLGAALSAVICAIISGMQYADLYHFLMTLAVFIFGNMIESNFISPKIIGKSIGLHPAWLLFGILTGGSLLGFFGILIAVPLTAAVATVIKFAMDYYKQSEFYTEV